MQAAVVDTFKFLKPPLAMPVVGLPQQRQGSAKAGDGSPSMDARIADPGTLARQLVGEIIEKTDTLCAVLAHHPSCLPHYVADALLAAMEQRIKSAILAQDIPPVHLGRLVDVTV